MKLEPVCLPERNPRPLSEVQVEALLVAIPPAEKRNRLLLTLLYETGMRVGEALGILLPQVQLNDMDGGYIRVIGKGDRERIIPLIDAPRTIRLLRDILKTLGKVGPLFRGDLRKGGSAGEALDYTTLYYHFERYLETARTKKPGLFAADAEVITIHRLLLCLYGLGTNAGIKSMCAGQHGENYKDLLYIHRRYITPDHLRNAITRVVNALFRVRHPHIWGEGTTACASDSKKFGS